MTVALYMDHHVPFSITRGLRQRGVDVMTAEEDGTKTWSDPELLNRATSLGRALFSQDEDLLAEAARRQHSGEPFAGVIYAHQLHITIGQCVNDLEILANVNDPADMANQVVYLPL
jgi:predicted nuclease of predicted toxin-antitoxin system